MVMCLARRGDVRAADAFLVIKGGHGVVVPARRTTRLSSLVQKGKLALRAAKTSTAGPPTISCAGRLSVRADGGFSAPTVVSTILDRVHGLHSCGGLGRPSWTPAAPIKGGSPPPLQRIDRSIAVTTSAPIHAQGRRRQLHLPSL